MVILLHTWIVIYFCLKMIILIFFKTLFILSLTFSAPAGLFLSVLWYLSLCYFNKTTGPEPVCCAFQFHQIQCRYFGFGYDLAFQEVGPIYTHLNWFFCFYILRILFLLYYSNFLGFCLFLWSSIFLLIMFQMFSKGVQVRRLGWP